jgi:hypothetical protein
MPAKIGALLAGMPPFVNAGSVTVLAVTWECPLQVSLAEAMNHIGI